jgi:hypothetical protein
MVFVVILSTYGPCQLARLAVCSRHRKLNGRFWHKAVLHRNSLILPLCADEARTSLRQLLMTDAVDKVADRCGGALID